MHACSRAQFSKWTHHDEHAPVRRRSHMEANTHTRKHACVYPPKRCMNCLAACIPSFGLLAAERRAQCWRRGDPVAAAYDFLNLEFGKSRFKCDFAHLLRHACFHQVAALTLTAVQTDRRSSFFFACVVACVLRARHLDLPWVRWQHYCGPKESLRDCLLNAFAQLNVLSCESQQSRDHRRNSPRADQCQYVGNYSIQNEDAFVANVHPTCEAVFKVLSPFMKENMKIEDTSGILVRRNLERPASICGIGGGHSLGRAKDIARKCFWYFVNRVYIRITRQRSKY
eukprot:2613376-Pleurochrysis_carterae.AAC.2